MCLRCISSVVVFAFECVCGCVKNGISEYFPFRKSVYLLRGLQPLYSFVKCSDCTTRQRGRGCGVAALYTKMLTIQDKAPSHPPK